jgi:hypothetical protein
MDWISFISAIGIGAITSKLLDVFILPKIISGNEKEKWLRDKLLYVYSELAKYFHSYSTAGMVDEVSIAHIQQLCSQGILITEDNKIIGYLNTYPNLLIKLDPKNPDRNTSINIIDNQNILIRLIKDEILHKG